MAGLGKIDRNAAALPAMAMLGAAGLAEAKEC
jgi:hypothetical protein